MATLAETLAPRLRARFQTALHEARADVYEDAAVLLADDVHELLELVADQAAKAYGHRLPVPGTVMDRCIEAALETFNADAP